MVHIVTEIGRAAYENPKNHCRSFAPRMLLQCDEIPYLWKRWSNITHLCITCFYINNLSLTFKTTTFYSDNRFQSKKYQSFPKHLDLFSLCLVSTASQKLGRHRGAQQLARRRVPGPAVYRGAAVSVAPVLCPRIA